MKSAVQTQGGGGHKVLSVCLSEVNVVCPVPAASGGLPALPPQGGGKMNISSMF